MENCCPLGPRVFHAGLAIQDHVALLLLCLLPSGTVSLHCVQASLIRSMGPALWMRFWMGLTLNRAWLLGTGFLLVGAYVTGPFCEVQWPFHSVNPCFFVWLFYIGANHHV